MVADSRIAEHLATLGVSAEAPVGDIKAAYRALAKKLHPDLNRGDKGCEEALKRVNEAYAALKDGKHIRVAEKAKAPGKDGPAREAPVGAGARWSAKGAQARPRPRPDTVEVTLREVLAGATRVRDNRGIMICGGCGGTGVVGQPAPCQGCGGTGSVLAGLVFKSPRPCAACAGTGASSVGSSCTRCSGHKAAPGQRRLLHIPMSVRHGDVLPWVYEDGTLVGEDARIELRPLDFGVSGDDLLATKAISADQAAQGAKVTIRGPDRADVKVKVPRGAADGTVVRLPGLGMGRRNGPGRGDLLVRLVVRPPKRRDAA